MTILLLAGTAALTSDPAAGDRHCGTAWPSSLFPYEQTIHAYPAVVVHI